MSRQLPRPAKQIDLHAEAFLDNPQDYTSDELLGETIVYFREMLDGAIYWDYNEIRFVHGKGKGLLRQLLYEELREYKFNGTIANYHPSYNNPDVVVVVIGL